MLNSRVPIMHVFMHFKCNYCGLFSCMNDNNSCNNHSWSQKNRSNIGFFCSNTLSNTLGTQKTSENAFASSAWRRLRALFPWNRCEKCILRLVACKSILRSETTFSFIQHDTNFYNGIFMVRLPIMYQIYRYVLDITCRLCKNVSATKPIINHVCVEN